MRLRYAAPALLLTLFASCRALVPTGDTTPEPPNTSTALYPATSLPYETRLARPAASASPTRTSIPLPSATVPFQLEWIQYHSDDLGASFEYPEPYETGPCGHLMTSEREGDFAAYGFQGDQIIFFDGSTIEISMKSPWNGDFDEHLESLLWQTYYAEEALKSDLLIDGLPAVRIERTFQGPAATAGDVVVLIVHEDRLYSFRWAEMNWVWCDVEGMGEYGIFEHILASWHFDQ